MTQKLTAGERTRERILDAALPLFAESGFAGTSTRQVAEAAEVNVATLAYHFQDKEGLYDTVVTRLHEELIAGWPGGSPPGNPDDVVDWWVRSAWRFALGHRQHIRLLFRHVLDRGGHPEIVLERWSEPLLQRAETILAPFAPQWTAQRRRLFALSVMHLLARYVLEDVGQLRQMLGGVPDPHETVVGFLSDYIRKELGLPTSST